MPDRKIATIKNPTIEATVNGLYRFENEKQALDRIQTLRDNFIISKTQDDDDSTTFLWIKGFEITDKESEAGYLGNFAEIQIKKLEDGKFALGAEKVETDIKNHPQKKRPKQAMPNWGHPILRKIKKGEKFEEVEPAQELLQRLHENFPETSIPVTNKVYAMVYSRKENPKKPIQKYVFEIKTLKEGGFFIEYSLNEYEAKDLPGVGKNARDKRAEIEDGEDMQQAAKKGYFASMVELKRSRKKPPPASSEGQ